MQTPGEMILFKEIETEMMQAHAETLALIQSNGKGGGRIYISWISLIFMQQVYV